MAGVWFGAGGFGSGGGTGGFVGPVSCLWWAGLLRFRGRRGIKVRQHAVDSSLTLSPSPPPLFPPPPPAGACALSLHTAVLTGGWQGLPEQGQSQMSLSLQRSQALANPPPALRARVSVSPVLLSSPLFSSLLLSFSSLGSFPSPLFLRPLCFICIFFLFAVSFFSVLCSGNTCPVAVFFLLHVCVAAPECPV